MTKAIGYPIVLADGPVLLRPYRRGDAVEWSAVRRFNERWLAPWEATPHGLWDQVNSVSSFHLVRRGLRRAAKEGEAMPFAICLQFPDGTERLVGHINLGNIVRRAFGSAYCGYWIDSRAAGQGIMPTAVALLVDHAFGAGGLHRVEINIRPENKASRRVVEKLGLREEGYHHNYMFIDGAWRDHVGYAVTIEDVIGEGGLLKRWHRLRGV
ncbi:ribosomal-protein-alanine N-acetyltransferase [Allocatelliglobosispora scoriae]|uniref:Ribosomal-protein-alanine N-acetyltransferase n=1 Tax=Allocatelliglobosispora scoriae TaxID=643052 RepID=A0A841BU75_9ACTN|nr:GNAT family protein [Allocatelliglobosispora scoriae]MBB5870463.1 ribosomal-protein-alanine N-acetyltransferase [Allocatelliglobosispora scoriae]